MTIRAIVLDFDGVVIESNQIKHQAFSELFSRYPACHDTIMTYHRAHNAIDRHQKFRYVMENIMHVPFSQKQADEWAAQYAALTRSRLIACPFVAGAIDFLREFHGRYPLYLASATPLDELQFIVEERKILSYFTGIFGAPQKKPEIFRTIAKREHFEPDEMVFIGDSREDYQSAHEFGCRFIARISDYSFNDEKTERFHDLYEIRTYIVENLMARDYNGLPDKTIQP